MPFDEESDKPSEQSQKIGLKKVSSQKSIFDAMPKKPTQEEFDEKVKHTMERATGYKRKASELALAFTKALKDKTLPQNKNAFQLEVEREMLTNMVQLAIDINNDPNEQEDMGSLSWITLLMKTCFAQRDRINLLEYSIAQLEKSVNELVAGKPKKTE